MGVLHVLETISAQEKGIKIKGDLRLWLSLLPSKI